MPKRIRLYEVTVDRGDRSPTSVLYSATTASKARMEAWRDFSDCWDVSFRDFLKVARVRVSPEPAPEGCYAYVRKTYGLKVEVGDRIVLKNEGEISGLEGEVVYPGPATAHVHVVLDYAVTVHPYSVDVLARASAPAPPAAHAELEEIPF